VFQVSGSPLLAKHRSLPYKTGDQPVAPTFVLNPKLETRDAEPETASEPLTANRLRWDKQLI